MSDILQPIVSLGSPFSALVLMALIAGIVGTITGVAAQIRKVVIHAADVRLKRDLVERGLSAEEIERVIGAKTTSRSDFGNGR